MDGGQPVDGSKWVTVQTRLQMQLSMCLRASPSIAKFKIFPPMGRQVFVTTLRSMGITILQTDFEADMEIAVLAKNLGYTVLSNDSDFIVCDVPLIRLESMNYKNIITETNKKTGETFSYIPCFLFNREEFCMVSIFWSWHFWRYIFLIISCMIFIHEWHAHLWSQAMMGKY